MGFFKRLFRRKSKNTNDITATENDPTRINSSTGRKSNGRKSAKHQKAAAKQRNGSFFSSSSAVSSPPRDSPTDLIIPEVSDNTNLLLEMPSSSLSRRGPDLSDGTQRPVVTPRSPKMNSLPSNTTTSAKISIPASKQQQQQQQQQQDRKPQAFPFNVDKNNITPSQRQPVDLDDDSVASSLGQPSLSLTASHSEEKKEKDENELLKQLSQQYTQQYQQQQQTAVFTMSDTQPTTTTTTAAAITPKLRFSAGNVNVNDDSTDDGESSSFNLSTDAEDTEYETMRRRLGAAVAQKYAESATNNNNLSKSNITSSNHSVGTNYTTDGENSVFPGLLSEDELTSATQSVTKEASQQSILNLPTVDPATGASLVPIDLEAMYENVGGFPTPPIHNNTMLLNQPKKHNGTTTITVAAPIATTDDADENDVEILPTNSTLKKKVIPALTLATRDSPDRQSRRSPTKLYNNNINNNSNNNNMNTNDAIRTHYNSHFMEAVYGKAPSQGDMQPPDRRINVTTSPKSKTTITTENVNPVAMPQSREVPQQFEPFSLKEKDTDPFFSNNDFDNNCDAFPSIEAFGGTDTNNFDAMDAFSPSSATDFNNNDGFADFANFSNFEDAVAEPIKKEPQPHQRNVFIEGTAATNKSRFLSSGTKSTHSIDATSQNSTSLSELLAQAKSKSARNQHKKSSRSVSSAPAMNASISRHQFNSMRGGSGSHRGGDATSVTDIIQSLEAANLSRATSSRSVGGTRRGGSHDDGQSSRDGTSSMTSKERMRRRRESRQYKRGGGDYSSNSDDDNGDSESWLFDEVTGALGPRGIAADLESLSGRSNLSNASRGNRSHRSHRSHRSSRRTSSSRRKTTAINGATTTAAPGDASVDSRGSRYSHKSSRSYISQMSEQSRSVANDLLRLEMQLAMVGSGSEQGVGSGGGGPNSVGNRSRVSRGSSTTGVGVGVGGSAPRRSTTIARRSRITITAPAGKLGIILANKADSKGTVVSGVRTSSPLADKITPGDRIVAIDGEDVSLMTVSEITTIMARKSDFDRALTVLTTPRQTDLVQMRTGMGSPVSCGGESHHRSSYRN